MTDLAVGKHGSEMCVYALKLYKINGCKYKFPPVGCILQE